jgi:hypothetical protein
MSDSTSSPARPVSLFTIAFLFVLFAAFFVVVRRFYHEPAVAPFVATPENLPKDQEWRATRNSRRATLAELRKEQAAQASTYGWVDEKTHVVRLPIDRAMELTAQDLAAKQAPRQTRDLPAPPPPRL